MILWFQELDLLAFVDALLKISQLEIFLCLPEIFLCEEFCFQLALRFIEQFFCALIIGGYIQNGAASVDRFLKIVRINGTLAFRQKVRNIIVLRIYVRSWKRHDQRL